MRQSSLFSSIDTLRRQTYTTHIRRINLSNVTQPLPLWVIIESPSHFGRIFIKIVSHAKHTRSVQTKLNRINSTCREDARCGRAHSIRRQRRSQRRRTPFATDDNDDLNADQFYARTRVIICFSFLTIFRRPFIFDRMIDLFHTHSPPTNVLFVVLLCGNPSFTQRTHTSNWNRLCVR